MWGWTRQDPRNTLRLHLWRDEQGCWGSPGLASFVWANFSMPTPSFFFFFLINTEGQYFLLKYSRIKFISYYWILFFSQLRNNAYSIFWKIRKAEANKGIIAYRTTWKAIAFPSAIFYCVFKCVGICACVYISLYFQCGILFSSVLT